MSAPQTNIEKQKRRHRGPLIGMAAVILAVGVIYAVLASAPIEEPSLPMQTDGATIQP